MIEIKILFSIHGITEFTEMKIVNQNFGILAAKFGNQIRIILNKKVPESLFNDLKTAEKSSIDFLLGYINKVLPILNQEILKRKYSSAQILNRPFSVIDIQTISLINLKNQDSFAIPWPIGFSNFPFRETDPGKFDYTYTRDLLDAMTSYLYFDFSESIRKIITSFENSVSHFKIKNKFKKIIQEREQIAWDKKRKITFNEIVDVTVWRPELRYNIRVLYKLRNKIVHDKLRLSHKNDILCHKGISTLIYIYMTLSDSHELFNYIEQIRDQFLSMVDFYRGLDLDNFLHMEEELNNAPTFLGPSREFDDYMFAGVKIKDKDIGEPDTIKQLHLLDIENASKTTPFEQCFNGRV